MDQEKIRDSILEINKSLAAHLSDTQRTIAAELFRSLIEFGKQTINGLFFLNGAAAVAIMYNKQNIETCWISLLVWCVAGAALAVICSAVSYFAQRVFYYSHLRNSEKHLNAFVQRYVETYFHGKAATEFPEWKESKLAITLSNIGIGIGLLSFSCFTYAFCRLLSEYSV